MERVQELNETELGELAGGDAVTAICGLLASIGRD